MASKYNHLRQRLKDKPAIWLVTGVAGFIGSNLLETLLGLDQQVVGLDNFSTGHPRNLDDVRAAVEPDQWGRFSFIEGDIRNLVTCQRACSGTDYILHQAALGSVPRSVKDPIATNQANIDGFLNMLVAARDAKVRRLVYAASSSTYGDHPDLPKVENKIGRPLSPYAVTKLVNELYADVFARVYGLSTIGLRYFNVFGPRQDPKGAYAAVIPRWIAAMASGTTAYINGDGRTTRDFCFIENCVQANLLAALSGEDSANQVYNIACGEQITLNELFALIRDSLVPNFPDAKYINPTHREFRVGDVRHSLADIQKAAANLEYQPEYSVRDGVRLLTAWYADKADFEGANGAGVGTRDRLTRS